jgi:hypothetical protein
MGQWPQPLGRRWGWTAPCWTSFAVRERTLAAEVEDVDIASLLQELRDMRRILGRRSS